MYAKSSHAQQVLMALSLSLAKGQGASLRVFSGTQLLQGQFTFPCWALLSSSCCHLHCRISEWGPLLLCCALAQFWRFASDSLGGLKKMTNARVPLLEKNSIILEWGCRFSLFPWVNLIHMKIINLDSHHPVISSFEPYVSDHRNTCWLVLWPACHIILYLYN